MVSSVLVAMTLPSRQKRQSPLTLAAPSIQARWQLVQGTDWVVTAISQRTIVPGSHWAAKLSLRGAQRLRQR